MSFAATLQRLIPSRLERPRPSRTRRFAGFTGPEPGSAFREGATGAHPQTHLGMHSTFRRGQGGTMSNRRSWFAIAIVVALSLAASSLALAGGGVKTGSGHHGQSNTFFTSLSGRQEVPAIHTK